LAFLIKKKRVRGDHVCRPVRMSFYAIVSANKPFVGFSWNSVWAFFIYKKVLS